MSNARRPISNLRLARQESNNATKPEVIGIAIAATVVVVLLLAGGLYCFFRRRRRQKLEEKRGGDVDFSDGDTNSLHETASKTPLMGQHSLSRATDTSIPQHSDPSSPRRAQRGTSSSTSRSLPPAYSSMTRSIPYLESHNVADRTTSPPSPHRPALSRAGSGGLRPLMLLEAQNCYGENSNHRSSIYHVVSPLTTSPDALGSTETLSLQPSRSSGRPRATSRFREEDIDM